MVELSSTLLYIAFILYLIATFLFGGSIRDKRNNSDKMSKWTTVAISVTIVGFISQLGYFITRGIASGHAPISNLYEFGTAFGMMLVFAFILLFFIYKTAILGLFTLPIALLLIAYASMYPSDITPLIPALQSDWLLIHVTTAALGQAILSISFVAGLIHLVSVVDQSKPSRSRFWLEMVMGVVVITLGFVIITSVFKFMDYEVVFNWVDKTGIEDQMVYQLPALVGPNEGEMVTDGKMAPIVELPPIINGRKLNTVIWSVLTGLVLYGLARLVFRKRLAAMIQPFTKKVNLELIDEIGYRSIAIGFPVFTLGALIFAMIWAQIAWTRFWGWDPKEVWALITFLFYAAYLHLRLSKGWHGEKSAWLAVIGFAIIMFNFIFVNLVIAGLHSYA